MPAAFTEEWLANIGADRDGRRDFSRSGGRVVEGAVRTVAGGTAAAAPLAGSNPARSANKFGAVRTEGIGPDGKRRVFDSRKEERTARKLNAEMSAGLIVSWVPQVSLPCGVAESGRDIRYRADALAILQVNPDGTFVGRFCDVKGRDTPASRAKRGAIRQLYQLDVRVI